MGLHEVGKFLDLSADAGQGLLQQPAGREVGQGGVNTGSLPAPGDDARSVEDPQMPGDVLRGVGRRVSELLNRRLLPLQEEEQLGTGRIGEKGEATPNEIEQRLGARWSP